MPVPCCSRGGVTLLRAHTTIAADDTSIVLDAKDKSVDELYTEIQDYASVLDRKQNIPDYEVPALP